MNRVIVIGCSGSGKTTFSRKLSEKTGLPVFHLDAIWHKSDRTHISREEFDECLWDLLRQSRWILDGDYSRTLERRMQSSDTVILLDFPLETCLDGVLSRLGQKRPDMPWIDTELDPVLQREVMEYREKKLPAVYSLIEKYKEGRRILIFQNREEADAFLDSENL